MQFVVVCYLQRQGYFSIVELKRQHTYHDVKHYNKAAFGLAKQNVLCVFLQFHYCH